MASGGFAGCHVTPIVPACCHRVMFQSCMLVMQAVHLFPAGMFSLTVLLSLLLLFSFFFGSGMQLALSVHPASGTAQARSFSTRYCNIGTWRFASHQAVLQDALSRHLLLHVVIMSCFSPVLQQECTFDSLLLSFLLRTLGF
jgi:hypothetical protein